MSVVNVWAGATTDSSARVRGKVTGSSVRLVVSLSPDLSSPQFFGPVIPTAQGIVSFTATGLEADTRYFYALEDDSVIDTQFPGQFRTHPPLGEPASFTYAMATCAGGGPVTPGTGTVLANFRLSNHRVFDTIREQDPLMFIHGGDLHYYDLGSGDHGIVGGGSLDNYRRSFDDVLAQPRQHELYRTIATAYLPDDHDRGPNDHDRTYVDGANFEAVYRERFPHYDLPDADAVYQSWQIGRVLFIASDVRNARDPNSDPQGPLKTMLGAAQKAWMDGLLATSDAELLVWVMPDEWLGVRADSWASFADERAELVAMLGDHGWLERMLINQGDIHELAVDTGSHPHGGFPVFTFAAMDSATVGSTQLQYDLRPTSQGHNRYGTVEVEDAGHSIRVKGTGWIGGWQAMSHEFTVNVAPRVSAAAGVQTVSGSATVDFGEDEPAELDAWAVEREIATDVPDQVRLVSGVSAASASLDVTAPEGETQGYWSPWRRNRRSTRRDVTIDATVDDDTRRVFVGRTTEAGAAARSQSLPLSALDGVADMARQVSVPAFLGVMGSALNPGLHPVWVIEHILRPFGLSPLPVDGPAPLVVASLAGSAFPSTGLFANAARTTSDLNTPPGYTPTTDLPLVASTLQAADWRPDEPTPMSAGFTVGAIVGDTINPPDGFARLVLFLDDDGSPSDVGSIEVRWRVSPEDLTVVVGTFDDAGALIDETLFVDVVDLGQAWVTLARDGSNVLVQLIQGGLVLGSDTVAFNARFAGSAVVFTVASAETAGAPMQSAQILEGVHAPAVLPSWTQADTGRADIALPVGALVGVPGLSGRDAAGLLREFADGEQGGFWIAEDGTVVFASRERLRGVGQSVIPVTSTRSLVDFAWSETAEQLASSVTVEVITPTVQVDTADGIDVWSADRVIRIDGFQTLQLEVDLDETVANLQRSIQFTATTGSRARGNTQAGGEGDVVNLSFGDWTRRRATLISSDRARITIFNDRPFPVWLVNGPGPLQGQPALVLAADIVVTTANPVSVRRDNNADTPNTLELTGNPWRQDLRTATDLAVFLAAETEVPRPVLSGVQVVPNLDIQLGSVVELQDPDVTDLRVRGLVRKAELSGQAGELTQRLEVVPLRPTLADFDAFWAGHTLGQLDTAWDGLTLGELDELWAVDQLDELEMPDA